MSMTIHDGPPVSLATREGVLTITLDSPSTGNALNVAMSAALAEAFERAVGMPEVNCVVLRSSGRNFCTGGDVRDMQSGSDLMQGSVEEVRERLRTSLHRITHAIQAVQVPVIAAVNGAAIGAGFDLAMMCDIRIASEKAQFAESFLRLGLISGIGGAWFLTRAVGLSRAMEMTLTSEFLNASTALQHGIVSRVVAHDVLDAEAAALAARIAEAPPRALRMAKQLVRESAVVPLSAALEMAGSMQAMLLCGQEHKGAVDRFLGARKQAAKLGHADHADHAGHAGSARA